MTGRRSFLAAVSLLVAPAVGRTQPAFPSQSVRVLVGYAVGGPLDTVARIVAEGMSQTLGQPVVVENKPGASGLIATDLLRQAPPDGHTISFVPSTFVVNPIMSPKPPYDPARDFAAVSHLATLASVMITAPESGIASVKDLVTLAKSGANVTYASTGAGGPAHLASELFQTQNGIETTHVPFKGSAPAITEVIAGRVTYMFHPVTGLREQVQARRVRALAVIGSSRRIVEFPDVPTMAEAGFPGYEDVGVWFGVIAPQKTPPAVVARLNSAVQEALRRPATLERLVAVGAVPTGGTAEQFQAFVQRDVVRWTEVIRAAKITLPGR